MKDRDSKGMFVKGNQVKRISKTDLAELVALYCSHRSQGFSKESFAGCDYKTIEANASEQQKVLIRKAESEGLLLYERIIQNAAFGRSTKIKGGEEILPENVNPILLIFTIKGKQRSLELAAQKADEELSKKTKELPEFSAFTIVNPDTGQTENIDVGGAD